MSNHRPRGFVLYRPRPAAQALIDSVKRILEEYADQLPITLRQLFYILVVRELIDKTEAAYSNKLCEVMNRARRARLIPMDAIRDDGFRKSEPLGYKNAREFLSVVRYSASKLRLNRQSGQHKFLVLWCEAAGMVPQLRNASFPYGVPVYSSGGFDSVTAKHEVAEAFADCGRPVEVLHIGDHDPSGVHVFGSLDEDVRAFIKFYGGNVKFTRLAVTLEQVEDLDLPTAPPKPTDRRSFTGLTTQAEAIDPVELARIVREALEGRMDMEVYQHVLREERDVRADVMQRLELLED